AMRERLRSQVALSAYDQALALDIDDHLGSVSPWKPTEFLLEAYDAYKAGRPPRFRQRPEDVDGEQSDIDTMVDALLGETAPVAAPRRSAREDRFLKAFIDGD